MTKELTKKRHKAIVILSIITLTVFFTAKYILSNEFWLSKTASDGIAIHIVIDNRTNKQIGPFDISDSTTSTTIHIDQVEPLSVVDVDFETPVTWGENAIIMTDSEGRDYAVVGYFEHNIRGRVDIRVECATSEGLSGAQWSLLSYYFSMQWQPWGTTTCE